MTEPEAPHNLIRFRTETGSRYELDVTCRQIRRVSGKHEPTPRQGKDGNWRQFDQVTTPVLPGQTVDIAWRTVDGVTQMTFTSRAIQIAVAAGCFAHPDESPEPAWMREGNRRADPPEDGADEGE